MEQIEFSQDLGITITKIRLLTREEFEIHKDNIPEADLNDTRTISYLGNTKNRPDIPFAEVGVLSFSDGTDTYSRIALEVNGVDNTELEVGNQFIFEGKLYTLLNSKLAISTFWAKNIDME